eukprot:TRINITY_DN21051_c0_g1_i1.p1 TRINITY_DN21051_c0_g1~~TRINITY_DN21051_c0_g1_i1.p1  ORF type:complete len:502 (+),score=90.04 TRINITY_DN21051_c0_g1_i1:513-2018(+)
MVTPQPSLSAEAQGVARLRSLRRGSTADSAVQQRGELHLPVLQVGANKDALYDDLAGTDDMSATTDAGNSAGEDNDVTAWVGCAREIALALMGRHGEGETDLTKGAAAAANQLLQASVENSQVLHQALKEEDETAEEEAQRISSKKKQAETATVRKLSTMSATSVACVRLNLAGPQQMYQTVDDRPTESSQSKWRLDLGDHQQPGLDGTVVERQQAVPLRAGSPPPKSTEGRRALSQALRPQSGGTFARRQAQARPAPMMASVWPLVPIDSPRACSSALEGLYSRPASPTQACWAPAALSEVAQGAAARPQSACVAAPSRLRKSAPEPQVASRNPHLPAATSAAAVILTKPTKDALMHPTRASALGSAGRQGGKMPSGSPPPRQLSHPGGGGGGGGGTTTPLRQMSHQGRTSPGPSRLTTPTQAEPERRSAGKTPRPAVVGMQYSTPQAASTTPAGTSRSGTGKAVLSARGPGRVGVPLPGTGGVTSRIPQQERRARRKDT